MSATTPIILTIQEILAQEKQIAKKEKVITLLNHEYKRRMLYQRRPDLWLVERFGEPINILKWTEYAPEYYQNLLS